MQIVGFSVRLSSTLLWIQIYRLGVSYSESNGPREADFDLRNSFLSPVAPAVARQCSDCDVVLGGSIYDPAYYSSLFEDGRNNRSLRAVCHTSVTCNFLLFVLHSLDKIYEFFEEIFFYFY